MPQIIGMAANLPSSPDRIFDMDLGRSLQAAFSRARQHRSPGRSQMGRAINTVFFIAEYIIHPIPRLLAKEQN